MHTVAANNYMPVFKSGNKNIVNNYCLISLTSVIVKTMERINHSKLTYVLATNALLSP